MTRRSRLVQWLFPLRFEAESKSSKAIMELEETIAEIRRIRADRLADNHRRFAEKDPTNELDSVH